MVELTKAEIQELIALLFELEYGTVHSIRKDDIYNRIIVLLKQ